MSDGLKNLLSELKGDSESMHFDGLDVFTLGFQNYLVETKQLLIEVLAKEMMIPFIEDYTKANVMKVFGLTNAEASSIQKTNVSLLNIHKMLQSYIIETYTIFSMLKKDMDELVLSSVPEYPVPQTMEDLFRYIQNYKEAKKEQSGGVNFRMLLLSILVKLILFSIVTGNTITSTEIVVPETRTVSELSLSKFDLPRVGSQVQTAIERIENSEYKMGRSANVSTIISEYDSALGMFFGFFDNRESGLAFFNRIVAEFNRNVSEISQECILKCSRIVEEAASLDIYKDYNENFDSVAETKDKLIKLEEESKKKTQEMINAGLVGVGATVATAATGDLYSAATYAYSALKSFGESGSTEQVAKQKALVLGKEDMTKTLTPSAKLVREDELQQISSLFCNYGFNLELVVTGTTITAYGDKIEYNSILGLIIMLERNIDLKIRTANISQTEQQTIDSLKERLQVLKAIVEKMREFVNFAFYARVSKLQTRPTPTSLNELQVYLNTQLRFLQDLSKNLEETFPISKEHILQKNLYQVAEATLQTTEAELKRIEAEELRKAQQTTNDVERIIAQTKAETLNSNTAATTTVLEASINSYVAPIVTTGEGMGNLTNAFGFSAMKIPLGLFEGATSATTNSFSRILYSLFTSPGGLAIVMATLFMLAISVGITCSTVYLFRDGSKVFLCIVNAPFVIVYRIIETSAGLAYKLYDFIVVSRRGRAITNGALVTEPIAEPIARKGRSRFGSRFSYMTAAEKQQRQEITSAYNRGGKKRKTRRALGKTRKVKKNLHKKLNKKAMKTKKRRNHNTRRKRM